MQASEAWRGEEARAKDHLEEEVPWKFPLEVVCRKDEVESRLRKPSGTVVMQPYPMEGPGPLSRSTCVCQVRVCRDPDGPGLRMGCAETLLAVSLSLMEEIINLKK